jgi:pimeloyl-ACP methyl ester carboxylesterase
MSDLFVESIGAGPTVLLVHGSLATGGPEWEAQRPLAEEGYRLLIPDRRGYGASPPAAGEDFLRDAEDLVELMEGGAHLVGHSYGCLGAMLAAAEQPGQVRSMVLLEPAALSLASDGGPAAEQVEHMRSMWDEEGDDHAWTMKFLDGVGTDPDILPEEVLTELLPLAPLLRNGRPPWEAELPLDGLSRLDCPKLVVTGGHSAAFDEVCDELARGIDAERAEIVGAGHEIQFTGDLVNEVLLKTWRGAS